jgi:hypothetical protein
MWGDKGVFVEIVSPVPENIWADMVAADQASTPYQTPNWMRGVCAAGGFTDVSRLYASNGERAILPLAAKSILPGLRIVKSLPYGMGPGGPLCDRPLSESFRQAIVDDLGAQPFASLSIRPNPLLREPLRVAGKDKWRRIERQTHALDLSGGYDVVWKDRFHRRKRASVRKAQELGVFVEKGNSTEFISRYYKIFLDWTEVKARGRRMPAFLSLLWARQRDSQAKLETLAKAMGKDFQVYVARQGKTDIAAALLLTGASQAVFWRGASEPGLAKTTHANVLVQNEMIRDACAAGHGIYHFGDSGGVESLMRYKEDYGATPTAYHELIHEKLPLNRGREHLEALIAGCASRLQRRGKTT